ncbi:unnamed protein product [Rotaria magnacalcarata]|uniref:G-protein coupled receptors family 3 profile domain-containing protein n=4 Tax=Rotaria magnacalcarata TaxID=392030 RepID=A0A816H9M8_9BILA|nr:unnamed protein product [Rotaria magnacalcarata]CAF1683218.1 unnamed protein product [Rotaria magnacalcarata]
MFFIVIILIDANQDNNTPISLHIGGLFNYDNSFINNGKYDLQAARMAIDEINDRYDELFNGRYKLNLLSNNSKCDPIYAVDAFFHAIFRCPQLTFLIGTSCINETKSVIQVADYYNLILFSHSTSFISQADQTYSTLVRLSVSDENYNDGRVAFIKYNNWSHVAILHQDSTEYSLMMAKLAKRLNESNINIILTQSASMINLTSALQTLREKKARIVFVNFDTSSRAAFFCEVYRTFTKELRKRYVWILTGNDFHLWNLSITNCSIHDIINGAHGHIIIDSLYQIKPSLINPNTTVQDLKEHLGLNGHLDRQILHAFDAIWSIALLIRASIQQQDIGIEKFSYSSADMKNQWLALLEEIYFHGLSGPVSFRSRQRQAETLISQFQIDTEQQIRIVAEYSPLLGVNTKCAGCRALVWPGAIPVDTERSEVRRLVMNTIEIGLITTGCILGLALAIFFLTFNIINRHQRYIKLSSPKLNNVMVLGAMHIHISIILFGLDEWFLDRNLLGHACMLRIFLLSGGFSLMFGSMFLKTLRVYRIFTSRDRPLLHSKLLQDQHLLLLCFILYGIDIIFMISWQIFDPHSAEITFGPIRRFDVDTIIFDEISYCDSKYRHKILPLIYVYKSLFLMMGGYLAAKTRHVHIAALNDSKFIVWSIYVVVLTSLFTVIVMISMQNLTTYVAICLVVIIMTSSILCLVFLPKVIILQSRRKSVQAVVSKDLVVDSSRTRRLVVEISHYEKYRYAQLQNRELKSELIRLNHILHTAEQRLESIPSNIAMAFFPLAVQLASTCLRTSDVQSLTVRSNSRINIEPIKLPKEDVHRLGIDSTSSNNTLCNYDRILSSISELDLSVALQPINGISSLPLSTLDNQYYRIVNDEDADENTNLSIIPIQGTSDTESVLYLRLPYELNVATATFDSDLDKIEY